MSIVHCQLSIKFQFVGQSVQTDTHVFYIRHPGNRVPERFLTAYSALGPAATSALPASLPVYLTKFFWNRPARSRALVSHSLTSA